ncbi:hypothetical protein CC79DRAFT_1336214 [Sarocladium strictum]
MAKVGPNTVNHRGGCHPFPTRTRLGAGIRCNISQTKPQDEYSSTSPTATITHSMILSPDIRVFSHQSIVATSITQRSISLTGSIASFSLTILSTLALYPSSLPLERRTSSTASLICSSRGCPVPKLTPIPPHARSAAA